MAVLTPAATESVEAVPFLKTSAACCEHRPAERYFPAAYSRRAPGRRLSRESRAPNTFNRQIVQLIEPQGIDIEINWYFFSADLRRAAGKSQRAVADGGNYI